jgi:predicted transcriptional regulator
MLAVTKSHELGPLEMRVLALFRPGAPQAAGDIQLTLRDVDERLAYTTVMTVLSRLHTKGLLTRKRDGRRYLYSLAQDGAARTSRIVSRIHRMLFETVRARPVASLLEADELSTAELRALRKLIDAKLKERKP